MTQTALAQLMIDIKPTIEKGLNVELHDASLGRPFNFNRLGECDFLYSARNTSYIELWTPIDEFRTSEKIMLDALFFEESMQDYILRELGTKIQACLSENQTTS